MVNSSVDGCSNCDIIKNSNTLSFISEQPEMRIYIENKSFKLLCTDLTVLAILAIFILHSDKYVFGMMEEHNKN